MLRSWRGSATGLGAVAVTAMVAGALATPASAAVKVSESRVIHAGVVNLRMVPVVRGPRALIGSRVLQTPDAEVEKGLGVQPAATALPVPSPANTPVVIRQAHDGFEGISHLDQRLAGNGNQFSLEPPDQGLCVGTATSGPLAGTTFVVESVNDALNIYDSKTNQQLLGPVTLSQLFGLPPTINRTTGRFGPFVTDPKCYFDPETKRWFHTAAVIGQNPKTGAFQLPVFTALAVSRTSDPTGSYNVYRIPAADTGHPFCPCFGDQPLIGADENGFYVETAEYDLEPFGGHANFGQLYAIDKRQLEAGMMPRVIHYANLARGETGTIQPATSPNGSFEPTNGGTEFLMSGFDCVVPKCALRPGQFNKITVWALTHTDRLGAPSGKPALTRRTLTSEVYGQPPLQFQRPGPLPLGSDPQFGNGGHTPKVQANDDRMNQVVFAHGLLFSGVNTIVAPGPRAGVAWFAVRPGVTKGKATGEIMRQGYIAARNANVTFPSIGVNGAGRGVAAFSIMGRRIFPSAAYLRLGAGGTSGPITISRLGFRPEDGFTCYRRASGDPNARCRWGDYSASVAGPDGRVWSATEFIPGGARTLFANWGTFVWPIVP